MRGLYEETHSSTQSFRLYSNKSSRYEYNSVIQININNYAIEGNKNIIEVYTLKNDDNQLLTNKCYYSQPALKGSG